MREMNLSMVLALCSQRLDSFRVPVKFPKSKERHAFVIEA